MSDKPTIKRQDFTPAQRYALLDANHMFDMPRYARGDAVVTYPIDDIHPEESSDRDDGIMVHRVNDGSATKYRAEITIADVAGYIPANSNLSHVGHDRAFTEYWPWARDSMFPPRLEPHMSLENHKERLGMQVIIDLNDQFQPIHTELKPVLAKSECKSYAQAHQLMQSDPNFKLMNQVATGIRNSRFGKNSAVMTELEKRSTDLAPGRDAESASVSKMVATYMILTNHQIANLFSEAKLPFIYRNFEPSSGKDATTKAFASTTPTFHAAMEKMGAQGAYCHFTSPIRRGQDFYNGHMAHYAVSILTSLENEIATLYALDDGNRTVLHHVLWDHASAILQRAYSLPMPSIPAKSQAATKAPIGLGLKDYVADLIQKEPLKLSVDHAKNFRLGDIESRIKKIPCPYHHATLEAYAQQINALNQQQRDSALAPLRKSKAKAFAAVSDTQLHTLDKGGFSSLLIHAAQTGELSNDVLNMALSRLAHDDLDLVRDAITIMIRQPVLAKFNAQARATTSAIADELPNATKQASGNWDRLKSAIASTLKNQPNIVNNICDRLHLTFEDPTKQPPADLAKPKANGREKLETDGCTLTCKTGTVEIELPPREGAERDEHIQTVHKAVISFVDHSGAIFSAPFYSLGNNEALAVSHAKYSFIEHFAFGQLCALDEAREPHPLYAKLNDKQTDKFKLLEEMARSVDAKAEIISTPNAEGKYDAMVIVNGGILGADLETTASDINETTAKDRAIRRMFRNDVFSEMVSLADPMIELFPHEYLIGRAQQNQMHVEENVKQIDGKSSHTTHEATVHLIDDQSKTIIASATCGASKKVSAVAQASWQILGKMHWVDDAQARSWANEHAATLTSSQPNSRG